MTLMLVGMLALLVADVHAVDRSKNPTNISDFTGDNVEMSKAVVGATVTVVAPYSTSRGALTILNISTNTVYLSSATTPAFAANNAMSFALPAGLSIQFRNNAAIYGVVDPTVSSMTIHVIKEY